MAQTGPCGVDGSSCRRGCPTLLMGPSGGGGAPWHGGCPMVEMGPGAPVLCGGVPRAGCWGAARRGDARHRVGGTTAPSGERAPRRCWHCAARAASWCGTARPAPTTTRSRSGECGAGGGDTGTAPGTTQAWGGPTEGCRSMCWRVFACSPVIHVDVHLRVQAWPCRAPRASVSPPTRRSSHGFVHVKLTRTREQHFVLGRAGAAFPSVPEAVRHYTARALPVRGARHLSLLYPVAVQPL